MKPHRRVLIIDDHAPSRAAVAEAVTAQGGQVVGNGSRAEDVLRLVDKHRPDVTDTRKPMAEVAQALLLTEAVGHGLRKL
ncbi:MAG: hypothetical protein WEG40_22535 [Candidatus Rokuibacteriota bacterium]